ncbi:hypothetical protein [Sphingomonas sp. VNH70]|uniref:hypothetical protein n=1 Tax=Sphingomonas silueang TaxID=3156617 RepID=UPI0032B54D55
MLALLAVQAVVASGFAPVPDTPYRYRIEQERDEAGVTRRYVTERTIRFARGTDGYVAEMTITAVDGSLSSGAGAMFERAFAGLRGVPMRYRLSAAGAVIAVEDRAMLWQRLIDGVIATAGSDPERQATVRRLTAPLAAMPEAQQVAMLGSMLATVLAPDVVRGGTMAERAIRQEGIGPQGIGTALSGTERVFAQGALLVDERRLAGPVALPGGAKGERVSELTRSVDPATGLIVAQQEAIRLTGPSATSRTVTRITRLEP